MKNLIGITKIEKVLCNQFKRKKQKHFAGCVCKSTYSSVTWWLC